MPKATSAHQAHHSTVKLNRLERQGQAHRLDVKLAAPLPEHRHVRPGKRVGDGLGVAIGMLHSKAAAQATPRVSLDEQLVGIDQGRAVLRLGRKHES